MSLHNAAQHLKEQGRGPDDQLVHMSSNELKGLHALAKAHGGELSINPNTGLPEAGFLDSILPTLIGAGLTIVSGGALSPLMAAGITGAGYGIATGDLSKGLMAGLGAYGGAGLGAGLNAAGASALGDTAANTAFDETIKNQGLNAADAGMDFSNPAAEQAAAQARAGVSTAPSLENMGEGIKQLGTSAGRSAAYSAMPSYTLPALGMAASGAMTPTQQQLPTDQYKGGQLANIKLAPGFKGSDPVRPNPYYQAQYPNYTTNPFAAAEGGEVRMAVGGITPPTPGLMDGGQSGNVDFMGKDMYPMSQQETARYASPSQMPASAQQTMASYEPATNPLTGEPTAHMASGGIASFSGTEGSYLPRSSGADPGIFRDTDTKTSLQDALEATKTQLGRRAKAVGLKAAALPKARMDSLGDMSDITSAAAGGTMHGGLGGYSDGGRMLKGPGDGMSDSIPASIGGKQPARLADGEFVVPADVVSHLGNGSTDAGAKKLYSMMDKIRKARTGKKKQAPEVKADKYMPV